MDKNQDVDKAEIEKIRGLADFDLTMLISEIHDHGWPMARRTLAMMPPEDKAREKWLRSRMMTMYVPRTHKNLREYLIEVRDRMDAAIANGLDADEFMDYVCGRPERQQTTHHVPDHAEGG